MVRRERVRLNTGPRGQEGVSSLLQREGATGGKSLAWCHGWLFADRPKRMVDGGAADALHGARTGR